MQDGLLGYLQYGDTVAINFALALVLGGLASDIWLAPNASAWGQRMAQKASTIRRAGFVLGLLALVAAIGLQAFSMSDGADMPLGTAAWNLLRETHLGHAWIAGLVGWLVAGTAVWIVGKRGVQWRQSLIAAAGLTVFVWSRSIVSHAGSRGDWSLFVAVDWIHLVLVSVWVGIVLVSAFVTLPAKLSPQIDGLASVRWVESLSTTATVALMGIAITGVYKTWTSVSSIASLWPSEYGLLLAVKVSLVAVAAALGGYNRFRVLPPLLRDLQSVETQAQANWRVHLVRAVRIEAVVLILVLVVAAVLSGTEPPDMG